jgi:methylphosphotriester-DNA--protein-cysteine methyltransferase
MSLVLARHVFHNPAAPWSRELLSSVIGLEPLAISRALFREGESFPQLVREQRLMRVLASLDGDQTLNTAFAAGYGFSEARRLAEHFSEKFDARLDQLLAVKARPARWNGWRSDSSFIHRI